MNDETLFTGTLRRFDDSRVFQKPIILANVSHRHLVDREIAKNGLVEPLVLLEPEVRNTAAAIASITELLKNEGKGEETAVFVPSDAYIDDTNQYVEYLVEGEQWAREGMMVCFGIKPAYPETGYGYIKTKRKSRGNSYVVDSFIEKPNLRTAIGFLKSEKYLWNSGMFMCKPSVISELLRLNCEELQSNIIETLGHSNRVKNVVYLSDKHFSKCKNVSFDYAIMEKLNEKQLMVVSMNLLWSDVGSYSSLFSMNKEKTEDNNVVQGNVVLNNTENCYIRANSRIVCCSDIEDLVIVEEKDVILVMRKNKSQNLKKLMEIIGREHETLK
jgi:mannose-1-phosphate guanylyltransferase/mannose-6-phosphate isomerase